jgi:hypothetical protein
MSEVISFRLNQDNPREAQALEVLRTLCSDGYSIRQIITDALLKLYASKSKPMTIVLDELNETLSQVNLLLDQIGNGGHSKFTKRDNNQTCSGLTDTFIASVRKTARSGLKLD